jgi:hypothetical protein
MRLPCDRCNRPFQPQRNHQRFCSRTCRLDARRSRRFHQRYRERSEREMASFKTTFTATPDAVCAECGSGMSHRRTTRRYCGDRCRQRACRKRRPNAVQFKARLDQALAHARAQSETQRRQRLLRAAERGDPLAAAELAKLT